MEIPHEQRFHFRDGEAVGSLEELKGRLEGISYQEFYHHVNADKNDFANWVRHVMKDENLAEDLEKVTSIVETVEILNDRIHPLPVDKPHEDIQSKIEEEELHIHVPVEEVPSTAPAEAEKSDEPADMKIIEEHLDEKPVEKPAEEHPAPAEPQHHENEHLLSKKDYTRLIVKDFMYGLIFGLIIGIILGKILTF